MLDKKKFVAILQEKKDVELSADLLHAHINYLKRMTDDGKLLICGPYANERKALFVVQTDSLEEAKRIVENDPFIEEGYYGSYELAELLEANDANCWLVDNDGN